MKLSNEQLALCVQQAARLKLNGWKLLTMHTIDELAYMANGIGPASFPEKIVEFINKMNPALIAPSVIHDVRYTYGTGTDGDFYQANSDLEINGKICAADMYGTCNFLRYYEYLQAHRYRILCDDFGRGAYDAAIADRKTKPEYEERYQRMRMYMLG